MLWFRDQGWHWAGGLIAALAFCYGASMAWRIQHIGQVLSLAYLPIALLCLDRALARGSILYGIARRRRRGRHRAGARPGRAAVDLSAGRLRPLAHPRRGAAARRTARAACCRSGQVRRARWCSIAVPVLLTAMLAQESNRPSIDYVGAARGSLHPALLLTLVMPDVFGASGRMEDYWGPPSFAWPDTGLFIAQNMGELYIGAIPLVLLLTAAVRGQLWAREIRFFTCAAAVAAALCARAGTRRSSACSTRCCPASASTAGRPMRRSWSAPWARSWRAMRAHRLLQTSWQTGLRGRADAGAGGGDHAGRRRTCCRSCLGLWIGRAQRLATAADDGGAVLCRRGAGARLGDGQRCGPSRSSRRPSSRRRRPSISPTTTAPARRRPSRPRCTRCWSPTPATPPSPS